MLETKISYQYEKWDYFVVLTFVLTTGTTICGLIPLWTSGGPLFSTMAVVMMAGLVFIILLVLLILPVIFAIYYKVNFKDFKYKIHDI
mgnify:CR=1 FL=1